MAVEINGAHHYSALTEGIAPKYAQRQKLLEQLGWEVHNCPVARIELHVAQMVDYVQRVARQVAAGAVPEGLQVFPEIKSLPPQEQKNALVRFWRPAAAQAQPPVPQPDPVPRPDLAAVARSAAAPSLSGR